MKFLSLLLVLFSLSSVAAEKTPLLRFWRGFVNPGADEAVLIKGLNEKLLPETIRVNKGKGLIAYLPALYPKEGRPAHFPAEVALVAYSSLEEYEAIRKTQAGIDYGDLHFVPGMFEKKTKAGQLSKSEVAVPYRGEVQLKPVSSEAQTEADAYAINAHEIDWQKGHAFLETLERTGPATEESIKADTKNYLDQLQSFQKQKRLNAAIVLINRRYLLSLFSFENEAQAREFSRSSAFAPKGYKIYDGFNQVSGVEILEPRRLLNFQF